MTPAEQQSRPLLVATSTQRSIYLSSRLFFLSGKRNVCYMELPHIGTRSQPLEDELTCKSWSWGCSSFRQIEAPGKSWMRVSRSCTVFTKSLIIFSCFSCRSRDSWRIFIIRLCGSWYWSWFPSMSASICKIGVPWVWGSVPAVGISCSGPLLEDVSRAFGKLISLVEGRFRLRRVALCGSEHSRLRRWHGRHFSRDSRDCGEHWRKLVYSASGGGQNAI
jgi:hypothetical protein